MKNVLAIFFLSAVLATGFGLGGNRLALAQASSNGALSPAQATALAQGIIQKGDNCAVYRALQGMDQVHALAAVKEIAKAGQRISPGSMGWTTQDGDPGNMLVTLDYVNQQTHGSNLVVYYTLFSKAHPVVDDTNSACSY